mmetsp:Transcript_17125/g.34240  ORF Transcript_17125/g.34240 Transcript_17125/m.34240 type:complete len:384 (+) Transcript_17125:55-1206(+)
MLALILGIAAILSYNAVDALALPTERSGRVSMRVKKHATACTSLYGWNGDVNNKNDDDTLSNFLGRGSASNNKAPQSSSTLITPQMEEEVLASARATMDTKAVSRAVSSLIDDDRINTTDESTVVGLRSRGTIKGSNKLRDLAAGNVDSQSLATSTTTNTVDNNNNNESDTSWNTQQIAIASGATVMILSPVIVPIIHVLLPPIIPSPSSVSFTGSALLGALSYIIALGDPTDQSNIIAGNSSGALGESVEVGGAVSRIVGRTALQTAKASAPRVRAVARAALDYDTTTATLEELKNRVDYLSRKTLELDDENQVLRYEVALFNAVEDVSSMYKLEELKDLARYNGVRGYSTESKNALLRRLAKEQVLELDLTPYFERLGDRL